MRSLNRTMLIGHLTSNPELRVSDSKIPIAMFQVATNRDWKSSDGEKKEAVDYHRIVAFRKLADICAQHLVKGSPVYLEGRLQNSVFDGSDGKKHYVTEIVLDSLNILVYKKGKSGGMEVNVQNVTEDPEVAKELAMAK